MISGNITQLDMGIRGTGMDLVITAINHSPDEFMWRERYGRTTEEAFDSIITDIS